MTVLAGLVDECQRESYLLSHPETPFPSHVAIPDPSARIVVVAGENASGKSVAFQVIAGALHRSGVLPITISIRERTGAGLNEMAGMRRSMMFGDESEQSTGATSFSTAEAGFRNVLGRAEEGAAACLLLDEPELGLSDAYAAAMGEWIAQQANGLPAISAGVVVVTHSRALVQALAQSAAVPPIFLFMGTQPQTLRQWLVSPEVRTVADLVALKSRGNSGRKEVNRLLAERKAERKTAPPLDPDAQSHSESSRSPSSRKSR